MRLAVGDWVFDSDTREDSSRVEILAEIRECARQHGHTFPILRDGDGKLAEIFDARRTPEAFLLDSSGRLRYRGRVASKISSPDLKNALELLLAGREVRPAETKAFGCAIPGADPGRPSRVRSREPVREPSTLNSRLSTFPTS